jgi:hypothetical protein
MLMKTSANGAKQAAATAAIQLPLAEVKAS